MRNIGILILGFVFLILSYFTFLAAEDVFRSDFRLPTVLNQEHEQHRLVLITRDMETPFWDKLGIGAQEQAEILGASLEIWGSYGNNYEKFLEKLEIAIYSKVDAIIIQGLDTEDFKKLTKIKAPLYGVPIIIVANDVPMSDSLRKTYVGSDQFKAGSMIARELLSKMGSSGKVVLMYDKQREFYQEQRLKGLQAVLKNYPNVEMIYAETSIEREHVIVATHDVFNKAPDADAYIAVNANIVGPMIQEIGKRTQVEPFHIYSFDDGPESLTLLEQGKIDGIIEQSPEVMGKLSVQLIMEWLNGETVPLDLNGYYTPIDILKATDER